MASAAPPDVKAIRWQAELARQHAHVIVLACRGAESGDVHGPRAVRDPGHMAGVPIVRDLTCIGAAAAALEDRMIALGEAIEGSFPETFANP
jgi:hypothetical protein